MVMAFGMPALHECACNVVNISGRILLAHCNGENFYDNNIVTIVAGSAITIERQASVSRFLG